MQDNEFFEKIDQNLEIAGKAILSGVPIIGSPIVEIMDSVSSNCLKKRYDKWIQELEDRLSRVEYIVEQLGSDEFFTSALIKATEIAIKTFEEEKRRRLANAVANSIDVSSSEEIMKMIFLDIIDRYTELHISMLSFFNNPMGNMNKCVSFQGSSSLWLQLESRDELKGIDRDLIKKIINDLENDGLVKAVDALNIVTTDDSALKPRTTKLGKDFLEYISE